MAGATPGAFGFVRRRIFFKYMLATLLFGGLLNAIVLYYYHEHRRAEQNGRVAAEIATVANRIARPAAELARAGDVARARALLAVFSGFPYAVCADLRLEPGADPVCVLAGDRLPPHPQAGPRHRGAAARRRCRRRHAGAHGRGDPGGRTQDRGRRGRGARHPRRVLADPGGCVRVSLVHQPPALADAACHREVRAPRRPAARRLPVRGRDRPRRLQLQRHAGPRSRARHRGPRGPSRDRRQRDLRDPHPAGPATDPRTVRRGVRRFRRHLAAPRPGGRRHLLGAPQRVRHHARGDRLHWPRRAGRLHDHARHLDAGADLCRGRQA